MEGLFQFLNLIGGLGIFLLGMKMMSEGIHKSAGEKFKHFLNVMTGNRVAGVFTGMLTTSVIQSSSATTVMLVSLVNAGVMTLTQSIGVIMGANIGTTLTAWIVSIFGFKMKITAFALPAIAIGLPFMFSKKERFRDIAEIFIGFGLLFMGLHLMKDSVSGIKEALTQGGFLETIAQFSDWGYLSLLLFVVIGTVITIIVQSSSAAMAITLTMAFNGLITFEVAAALVLGENIGTTITAFLASLGMNVNAKRAARAHMVFNLIGVTWMLIAFYPVTGLITDLLGDDPENLPIRLSAFHTFFNIANTMLLIWFVPVIERLVKTMIPKKESDIPRPYMIPFLHSNLPDGAEVNLINARAEIGKMASVVFDMLFKTMNATEMTQEELVAAEEEVKDREELTDEMQEELTHFLSECVTQSVTEKQAESVSAYLRITNELESISDSCYKVLLLVKRLHIKNMSITEESKSEIKDYAATVLDFLKYNADFLNHNLDTQSFTHAKEMENAINDQRTNLQKLSRTRITKGADIKSELVFMEIIRQLEHIGDFSLNVASEIKRRY